jgi:hypothetical protein
MDIHTLYFVIGSFCLVMTLLLARRLVINRNRFMVTLVQTSAVLTLGCLAVAQRWLPVPYFFLFLAANMILSLRGFGERPVRMDYNLFLRAAEGLLRMPSQKKGGSSGEHSRKEMLVFARFLGSRWLVVNFRWSSSGLELALTPAQPWREVLLQFGIWARASRILLTREGRVRAKQSNADRDTLVRLGFEPDQSELRVEEAVEEAWAAFRQKQVAAAASALGEAPEEDLFVVAPGRSPMTRWHRRITIALTALMVIKMGLLWLKPVWMTG